MEEKFVITEIRRVIMVGKDEYKEQKTSFKHNIQSNELIFNFSGHSTVYFNGIVLEQYPKTIRFLPKGETSRYEVFRHERGECIDVFFDTDRPISDSAFLLSAAKNESIGVLFKKLFSTWVGKAKGYYFECISLLYKIFTELQNDSYVPSEHYLKIKPAVDHIRESFLTEDISVPTLAKMCGITESYFGRLFKEKYGTSPKKHIIGMKINHATELLRLGDYSVTSVAEMSGFSDVYFFSRQFKEYIGLTPTEFVKKYKSSK
jgi:AraC-like DNA-binding protein